MFSHLKGCPKVRTAFFYCITSRFIIHLKPTFFDGGSRAELPVSLLFFKHLKNLPTLLQNKFIFFSIKFNNHSGLFKLKFIVFKSG